MNLGSTAEDAKAKLLPEGNAGEEEDETYSQKV